MLATDDERREVARRLRAIEPDDFGSYSEEHECVEKILGTWDDCDKFLWRVVADLIEPSGHECVPGECPINVRHDNDRIDRDALLALADDIHRLVDDQEIRFFHVVQVHESTLSTIERRIREAVGA